MADVSIDGTINTSIARGLRSTVFVDADIGYQFYFDGSQSFVYSKTTDGGASWGAAVAINTDTGQIGFDVWFDQWTPGDSGTIIHTASFGSAVDDVLYRGLDTNGDSLGTQTVVLTGSTAVAGIGAHCSITKAVGGNIYVSWDIDAGAERGFKRSTDGGASWSAALTIGVEAVGDWMLLFPANVADNQDIWGIYFDTSANAVTLKEYDNSGNSWSESASIVTYVENTTDLTGQYPFSASLRHSDGHLILSVVTERDTGTADHRVFDINGTGSITELTAITTNIDDHHYPSMFIDQSTDDIYIAYNGKNDGSEVLGTTTHIYYQKSTDDGANWDAAVQYSEGSTTAKLQTWAPLMGSRFYVSWRVGTTLLGNEVNSVTFGGGPTDFPIDAQPGSFAVTGVAATVVAGRTVDAQPGSFALTGVLANLVHGFFVDAQPGGFSLTGVAASLLSDRVVDAQPGAYVVTGEQAGLMLERIIDAQPGVFALTGFDADLVYVSGGASFEMNAEPGAYAITGNETTIVVGHALNAEAGSLVITGVDAGLLAARILSADPGAFAITGSEAQLLAGRILDAQPGAYTVTGVDADLTSLVQYEINAEPGVYTITGIETWGNLNFEQFPSLPLGSRMRIDLATGALVLVINDKAVLSL